MSWARCTHGHAHWGPRGAAGLLLGHEGRVLLQLRARWAHQGGTWSIPGGAIERGETAVQAALRESHEELGIDPERVTPQDSYVAVCGGWTYETVLARASGPLQLSDKAESAGHRWVQAAEVDDLDLHPAFRQAWSTTEQLRAFVTAT
ncbi:NUDIX domain-containing protein [Nocardioides sp.]|uniref:NUDIX domain-containing protein n=1 Tax=Nocardioides sp. TaxID=35761 RepID=UPI00356AFC7A